MSIAQRIATFVTLGERLQKIFPENVTSSWSDAVTKENAWFTPQNIALSISNIIQWLQKENIEKWLVNYPIQKNVSCNVGLIMAGNIPLVGFHDMVSILLAGHNLHVKPSSRDWYLPQRIAEEVVSINKNFRTKISFVERLAHCDAVIATGRDNTNRYFLYHFHNLPCIIRKNRSSCAVLSGKETTKDLIKLGQDIFDYFGLGCRSVSKLYVPVGYNFDKALSVWHNRKEIIENESYVNNYQHQKAIYTINQEHFYDIGNLLIKEDQSLSSPIAVLYYEKYKNQPELEKKLNVDSSVLQCVVSNLSLGSIASIPFGTSQQPTLTDYADQIDTMKFLTTLS